MSVGSESVGLSLRELQDVVLQSENGVASEVAVWRKKNVVYGVGPASGAALEVEREYERARKGLDKVKKRAEEVSSTTGMASGTGMAFGGMAALDTGRHERTLMALKI